MVPPAMNDDRTDRSFRRAATPLLLATLLAASGCCGGYAVVRTTVHEHAAVSPRGELSPGAGTVLHYSRLGEPLNSCGSGTKYVEELWIQVPSAEPGAAFPLDAPGVVAVYVRDQEGNPVKAAALSGKVRVKERKNDTVSAVLDVTIRRPSGETVRLDDDYAFYARPEPR